MAGVVTDEEIGEWGRASATFSDDRARRYRYLLTRTWDASLPVVNFVMLNPSTADAFVLDPTNRRCVGFARDWGFDGLVVTDEAMAVEILGRHPALVEGREDNLKITTPADLAHLRYLWSTR